MSASVKMTGGGGGVSASIFVKGLSETDVVTASRWGTVPVPNPEIIVPEEYTQLEYLESTGNQCIDTQLIGSADYITTVIALATGGDVPIFGSNGGNGFSLTLNLNGVCYWRSIGIRYESHGIDITKPCKYVCANRSFYINDAAVTATLTDSGFTTGSKTVLLFGTNIEGSEPYLSASKIYKYEVKSASSGAVLRNFVPAKRNSDGVLGMYDIANDVFYTNVGTGEFIAGVEVPRYVDGLAVVEEKAGKWTPNTITESKPLIPVMTSNTSPYGTASATAGNSEYLKNAYIAFDGYMYNNADVWYGSAYSLDTKIVYTFAEVQTNIHKVMLKAHVDAETTSKALNSGAIEYTEDGSVWKTLVNLNAENFTSEQQLEFDVNAEKLLAIRVGATDTSNGRGLMLSELQVYGYVDKDASGHLISRIKDFGMWTVTATNGYQTATEDVLIDVITNYEIEMELKNYLMLYDAGDECEEVTGSWGKTSNYSSATKNGDNVYFSGYMGLVTNQKVDVTGYSTLFAQLLAETGASYPWCGLLNSHSTEDRVKFDDGGHVLTNVYLSGGSLNKRTLCPLTISAFEGSYYVGMVNSNSSASGYCYNVFLTKPDNINTLCSNAGLSAPADLATLIADTTSIAAILASEEAVKYMVSACTGNFMVSFIQNTACLDALNDSPYVDLVFANKHWKKFLKMVGVTGKRLYLYRDGDECVDVTGGWVAQALGLQTSYNDPNVPTLTKNDTSMVVSRTGVNDYRCGIILPQNKIDFTGYGAIKSIVDFSGTTSNCLIQGYFKKDNLGSVCNEGIRWFEFSNGTPAVTNALRVGDISTHDGLYIPYIALYAVGSLTIHRLWIEEVL